MIRLDQWTGIRNDIPTERLVGSDLAVAQNVLVDDSLRVARRPGATLRVALEGAHSLFADADEQFVAADQVLYRYVDGALSPLWAGLTPSAPVSYQRLGDRVFFCNGFEAGVIEQSMVRSWGIAVPGAPDLFDAPGNLDPGTYQVTISDVRADGQESGAGTAIGVQVSSGGIEVVLPPPPSDPDITHRVVYATTANGAMLYEAVVVAHDAIRTTITDAVASVPIDTLHKSAVPDGAHLVAEYKGCLLVAAGQMLYHSEPYGPELFDALDVQPLDGRITMLAPTQSGVFVGTDRSLGLLMGDEPASFSYTQIDEVGVIAGSAVTVPARLMDLEGESLGAIWLSSSGIMAGLAGGTTVNLTHERVRLGALPARVAAALQTVNGSTYYRVSI